MRRTDTMTEHTMDEEFEGVVTDTGEVRTLGRDAAGTQPQSGVSQGTLGHDTVGVTPTGEVGQGSANGDLSGGAPVGIEDTGSTAGRESVRGAAGQE